MDIVESLFLGDPAVCDYQGGHPVHKMTKKSEELPILISQKVFTAFATTRL